MYWKELYTTGKECTGRNHILQERNVQKGTVYYRKEMYGRELYTTGKECTGRNRIYYWKGMYGKEPYLILERNVQEGTVITTGK